MMSAKGDAMMTETGFGKWAWTMSGLEEALSETTETGCAGGSALFFLRLLVSGDLRAAAAAFFTTFNPRIGAFYSHRLPTPFTFHT